MKSELQRIETTLEKIEQQSVLRNTNPRKGFQPKQTSNRTSLPSFSIAVKPFTTDKEQGKIPALPKLKHTQISTHNNAANPALAMSLLKDIEETVAGWQQELQKVQREIQDIYLEGPIIDGWLESHNRQAEESFAVPRKSEKEHLMNYVEEIVDSKVSLQSPRTGYRLCGLDANGQLWSRNCPPDQVPEVSVAIARYQKLKQLLHTKQDRENRLSQLAETLVVIRSNIN